MKSALTKVVAILTFGFFGLELSKLQASRFVVLETTQGSIELELKNEIAPIACENFEQLVLRGYYDGVVFHRVIRNFMIQTGDPTGTGVGGESIFGKPFPNECHAEVLFNKKGLLAMVNNGPNTNGSQFFITTVPTYWLNGQYTIFGEVISGFDVVTKIEHTKTWLDRPVKEQKILRAYLKPDLA